MARYDGYVKIAAFDDNFEANRAPIHGPNKNPNENAIPTRAIADDRLATSLKSVIIAIHKLTFDFEIPPTIRLIKKIEKTLEYDQMQYEIKVPVKTNSKTGFLPKLSEAAPIRVDDIN